MTERWDRTAKRKRIKELMRKRTHDLGERVKELYCLYGISNLVLAPDVSLEETLQGTVDLIPPGWQYPEVTCARITLEGQEFRTENFRETAWRQTADIIVNSHRTGAVEVCYLQEKPQRNEGLWGPRISSESDCLTEDGVRASLTASVLKEAAPLTCPPKTSPDPMLLFSERVEDTGPKKGGISIGHTGSC